MRELSFKRNILRNPAGSCLVAFGNTQVMCSASIERSVPPFLRDTGTGWVTAEYAMLPGSTPGGRKRREIGKRDGRSTEIQRLVGRSLRAAVNLTRLGEVTITVDCDVIEADGGTRTAAISGG
ncbi:MAG: ribonuclease PH, partial [Spirochaetota bacterium]